MLRRRVYDLTLASPPPRRIAGPQEEIVFSPVPLPGYHMGEPYVKGMYPFGRTSHPVRAVSMAKRLKGPFGGANRKENILED